MEALSIDWVICVVGVEGMVCGVDVAEGHGGAENTRPWWTEKGVTMIPVSSISNGTFSSMRCHLNSGTLGKAFEDV